MSLGKLRIFTKNQGYFYQTGTKDNLLFKCPLPDQSSQVLLKNAPPCHFKYVISHPKRRISVSYQTDQKDLLPPFSKILPLIRFLLG